MNPLGINQLRNMLKHWPQSNIIIDDVNFRITRVYVSSVQITFLFDSRLNEIFFNIGLTKSQQVSNAMEIKFIDLCEIVYTY